MMPNAHRVEALIWLIFTNEKQRQTKFELKPNSFLKTQMRSTTHKSNKNKLREYKKGWGSTILGWRRSFVTKRGNGSRFFMLISAAGSRRRRSRYCTCLRDGYCSLLTVLTRWGSLRNFYGFKYLLWESDRAKGEGEMRKEKKMGTKTFRE